MTGRPALALFAKVATLWLSGVIPAGAAEDRPPNIILIVIDDLGWSDLSCYGSNYYRTPNIDRLAEEGIRYTDGYASCCVCSPTRAAIMTGKSPARLLLTQWLPAGRWDRQRHRMIEGRYLGHMPLEEVSIAEALREADYRTGFVGKWHLGTEPYYYPEHQGFDVNIAGRDYGAPGSYFYPFEGKWTIPGTGQTLVKSGPVDGKPGDYLVDRLSEEAVGFIRDSADGPFFLVLSHYAVHAPLQGKPEKVAQYEAVSRADRQGKPAYAAMIESVDESVGRVLTCLSDLGQTKNTLVFFTSDNGGYAKATSNAPLRANKGTNFEGGIRVPVIARWPGKIMKGRVAADLVHSEDFYPTILAAAGLPQRPHQHIDGLDLSPTFVGKPLGRDDLYWHYPHYNRHPHNFPSGVVRSGDFKLIENYETGESLLFNLANDLGETTDLAATHPDVRRKLEQKLSTWRDEVGADSMRPNPEWTGADVAN